jgi:hypothetical protein
VLTGTLPHLSQQNAFLGLPLLLMPEELVLLIEKRELLVPVPAAHFHLCMHAPDVPYHTTPPSPNPSNTRTRTHTL